MPVVSFATEDVRCEIAEFAREEERGCHFNLRLAAQMVFWDAISGPQRLKPALFAIPGGTTQERLRGRLWQLAAGEWHLQFKEEA